MTPDYNKPPYTHWAKCPHTCPHTNSVKGSRRAAHLRTLVFDQDGVQIAALHADYLHPFSAPSLAMHACLKSKHEFCNKDNCNWTHILADDNKPLLNGGTTSQIRQNLTAEDWQKHGVALAILYSDHHNFYQVPAEYYDRALPILQQHLTPEKYNAVLKKRNPPAKANSGFRIVGDNILESTAGPGPSATIHGTSRLPPRHDASRRHDPSPPQQQNVIDRNTNQTHRRSHSPPPHQNNTNRSSRSPLPLREVSKIPTLKADGAALSDAAPQEIRKASEVLEIEEDLDSLTSDEEDSAMYKGLAVGAIRNVV
ncbi:hypothetical protein H0H93_003170 [Arthromyces matolae]|nr:hypothetical protein H0H93_003170 [Arthromyces matolae]